MGVITVCDIDYGRIFGPFPTQVALMDPTYVIGMLTQDKRSEGPVIEVDPDVNNGLARASEWLAYIQPARDEEEQNVEAYMKNGQVFYRTLRIIKASEELFVWYSKDFCQLIDMPEVKRSTIQETVNYICQSCGEMFHHVFPLRAHMRFKCEVRRQDNKFCMNSQSKGNDHEINKSHTISPGRNATYEDKQSREIVLQSRKRHMTDEHDRKGGKISVIENSENKSPSSVVPVSKTPEKDLNANIHVDILNENGQNNPSAFRKVEKSYSPSNTNSSNNRMAAETTKNNSPSMNYKVSTDLPEPMSSHRLLTAAKEYMSHPDIVSSVIPSHHQLVSASLSPTRLDPQLRASMMEAYTYALPQSYSSRREAVMGSVNVGLSPPKAFVFADKLNTTLPYIKHGNPMVGALVQNPTPTLLQTPVTSLPVSQNWCAKCNASFRMTSDLVYHMRSHHKREFDPVKKKRDDKLKCNICHETFRERHHLTRHMTSHA